MNLGYALVAFKSEGGNLAATLSSLFDSLGSSDRASIVSALRVGSFVTPSKQFKD
jgi:hypothetical protein